MIQQLSGSSAEKMKKVFVKDKNNIKLGYLHFLHKFWSFVKKVYKQKL